MTTYDPNQVVLIIDRVPLEGFPDGATISLIPDKDNYNQTDGTNGAYIRSKQVGRGGMLTVPQMINSPTNAVLSAMEQADYVANAGKRPFFLKSRHGLQPTVASGECWVHKRVEVNLPTGGDAPIHEWSLKVGKYELVASAGAGLL